MKTVYLLLTRSSTLFSSLIHLLTRAPYTHVSIAVSEDPAPFSHRQNLHFYSFGRKLPHLPFPAGLVRETEEGGFFQCFPDTPCMLLALAVPDQSCFAIASRIRNMAACETIYH